jgi:1-deoxy-D-xylulose-5-phosphate synthase
VRQALQRAPVVGSALYDALHAIKKGLKDVLSPQGMFEDLGLKYVGPVDGHDIDGMESALRRARSFGGPVIVHAVTTKGFGYPPAETDQIDAWHATGVFDPDSGPVLAGARPGLDDAFSDELVRIGAERSDVVAITAAMLHPTGLAPFAERLPGAHLRRRHRRAARLTSAAGLAMAGLHPVVAIYSTFLNRAFDQMLMDVALHRQPVTVVLDRAGVTGSDGASHNGMWDMSILSVVPGLRLAAPRDGATLRQALRESVEVTDGPTVVRFPKGTLPPDVPALERRGPVDVLRRAERHEVLLVAVGSMVPICLAAAERAAQHGIHVTVVDPRWVQPVPAELVDLAAGHRLVVTVEDGGRAGGVGTTLTQALQDRGVDVPLRSLGLPQAFLEHGSVGQVLADAGLTEQDVARRIAEWTAVLPSAPRAALPRWSRSGRDHGHRGDPGGALAAGHRRRPARPRRGGHRGHPGLRPPLRGRALGTTLEGEADEVWATLRAAHEAVLAAGATSGISHVKVASVNRTMESLTRKFR